MKSIKVTPADRLELAKASLDGLSIGDAFGQTFFASGNVGLIPIRQAPPPQWPYTDDTAMAISVVRVLELHGRIDQDELARRFASVFAGDPNRGYGHGAISLMENINRGAPWQTEARALFRGEGSMGNGAAMRIAPLGAYFADDLKKVVAQARLSAEVTHAHPDAQAGAIAVALAAAFATRYRRGICGADVQPILEHIVALVPEGMTSANLQQAACLPGDTPLGEVVATLGNGSRIVSFDTVPFCLWCAFTHLNSFEDALWASAAAGGDVDTTTAIVGGIVASAVGSEGVPEEWRRARESIPYPMVSGDNQ